MATPSVLTVPSMYGDGILYSGPTVFGPEIVTQFNGVADGTDVATLTGWSAYNTAVSRNVVNEKLVIVTSGGNQGAKFTATTIVGRRYLFKANATGDLGAGGIYINSGSGVNVNLNTSDTRLELSFTADSTTTTLFFRAASNSAGTTTYSNITLKEVVQGSDFDFTRATTGTRINEDGYIEDVPYNLLSYTEQLTDSYWNKISVTVEAQPDIIDPKNGRGAFKVTDTSGGGTSYLHVPSIANANYGRSVYARTVSGTGTVSLLSYYGNTNNLFTLTEQWQRFYVDSVTTTTGQINFYAVDFRAGDLTEVLLYAPQMTKSPDLKPYLPTTDRANLPRLNYPVYGGCPSLLVEPQRTNIVIYSNDLTQWSNSFSTDESNVAISPEGIQNAGKLIDTTSTSDHYISTPNASIAYDTITANSVFIKKGTFNHAQVRLLNGTGTFSYVIATFNLDTGELLGTLGISGTTNASYKIEKYPNDWWRITLVGSFTNSNVTARRYSVFLHNGTTQTYTGTGNDFIYIYGAQIEQGSYPTSLIHTSGSTVTRNEDKAENAGLGTTDTFNDDEGVLYAELRFDQIVSGNYIGIDDGTTSNRIIIGAEGSNIRAYSPGFTFSISNLPMFDVNKIAFSWQTNLRKLFINGVKLGENTSAYTGPTGLNQLAFDSGSAIQIFDGEAKAVAVYKTALTDTELANLTSYNNHDLFIPYRSRMQMIGADQELQCTEHDITRFL